MTRSQRLRFIFTVINVSAFGWAFSFARGKEFKFFLEILLIGLALGNLSFLIGAKVGKPKQPGSTG